MTRARRPSFRRPEARAVLSLALLGGLFGHGAGAPEGANGMVVTQQATDPYARAPRGGLRGFIYRVARPAFDSERRAPLLISSYAGRRGTDAPGLAIGRRKVRAAEYRGPAPGSAASGAGAAASPGGHAAPGFP